VVGFKFLITGSLAAGPTINRFLSLSNFPEANHAGWPDISAKVVLRVANRYSLVREIVDFSYFLKF